MEQGGGRLTVLREAAARLQSARGPRRPGTDRSAVLPPPLQHGGAVLWASQHAQGGPARPRQPGEFLQRRTNG